MTTESLTPLSGCCEDKRVGLLSLLDTALTLAQNKRFDANIQHEVANVHYFAGQITALQGIRREINDDNRYHG